MERQTAEQEHAQQQAAREEHLEPQKEEHEGNLTPHQQTRLGALAASMTKIFGRTYAVEPDHSADLSTSENAAVLKLYYAFTDKGPDRQEVDGLEKMKWLNQALAALQPLISLGLTEEAGQFKSFYAWLSLQIARLRKKIGSDIGVESVKFRQQQKPDKDDDDEDDDDDTTTTK